MVASALDPISDESVNSCSPDFLSAIMRTGQLANKRMHRVDTTRGHPILELFNSLQKYIAVNI